MAGSASYSKSAYLMGTEKERGGREKTKDRKRIRYRPQGQDPKDRHLQPGPTSYFHHPQ
jgi:hypothetical protein